MVRTGFWYPAAYELENPVKKKITKASKNSKTSAKRAGRERTRPRKPARPARSLERLSPVAPVVDPEPEPSAVEAAADSAILIEIPEPRFASRVLPPEPDRPLPTSRRAIFYDVENASRPEHIARVIEHLEVDRAGRRTDFVAVGNWRVIGHDTARLLARHGAHLVHSAPSVGVRDWSDLRIAVAAGVWLAGARPGDAIEIVTNDRAFDAVGDVAASLGIAFRRLSHQAVSGAPEARAPVREAPTDARSRRRGRGRRYGSWRERVVPAPVAAPPAPLAVAGPAVVEPVPAPAVEAPVAEVSAHTAPHDEIIAVVHELMQRATGRPVTLDTLANALKARGFSRPPGSPRLITRLRRIKEIALSRTGVITLVGDRTAPAPVEEPGEPTAVEPDTDAADVIRADAADAAAAAVDADAIEEEEDEGPGPGNEALPAGTRPEPARQPARRRRFRRGGRGRRPQATPAA